MTPNQFRAARRKLGKSEDEMADALGLTGRAIKFYEAGERQIRGPLAMAVNCLLEHPQPKESPSRQRKRST